MKDKIIVHVKHYLNEEGRIYLQQIWLPRVKDAMKVQPEFLDPYRTANSQVARMSDDNVKLEALEWVTIAN